MLPIFLGVTLSGAVRSYHLESVSAGRDVALMQRVANGDGEAFGDLVKRYTRMLYNVAYRYNASSAEDLVQEAFLRAYQHANTFSGRSKVSSWLYRICVNVCLTYQGKAGLQMADIDEINEAELVSRSDDRPEASAERGETFRALEDGLRSLPSQQRMVFILRELQGLSYGEIADILGINEQAARTNLCRAKRRLQVWLDPLIC
jgi:RNA polymerase sigma-70 factor (ECF subfamily)